MLQGQKFLAEKQKKAGARVLDKYSLSFGQLPRLALERHLRQRVLSLERSGSGTNIRPHFAQRQAGGAVRRYVNLIRFRP